MLDDHDQAWLVRQLAATAELLGHAITPAAAAMLANDLSAYPREVLARALYRVRTEHGGKLTPKAIIDRLDEALGRLAPNEAWSLALKALDERETVVWPKEAEEAWGAARPVAAAGDMVGARMAFLAAYERLVRNAREARELPQMIVSIGWDTPGRERAIEKALQLGYITPQRAAEVLVLCNASPPAVNGLALLDGKVEAAPGASANTRARIDALRDELAKRARKPSRAMVAARAERMRLGRLKREADAAVTKAAGGKA